MGASTYFLGIGAQKAGTTSLADFLKAHPEAYIPPMKEVHYFNLVDKAPDALRKRGADDIRRRHLRLERALAADPVKTQEFDACMAEIGSIAERLAVGADADAYRRMLAPRDGAKIGGEITPAYAILDKAGFERIAATLGTPKVIFLMRNPVDRYLSQVAMSRTPLARDQDTSAEPMAYLSRPGFVERSRYETTLTLLDQVFPKADVHVGFFETLYGPDAKAEHKTLCNFLGISDTPVADVPAGRVFKRKKLPKADRLKLAQTFASTYSAVKDSGMDLPQCWQEDIELLAS